MILPGKQAVPRLSDHLPVDRGQTEFHIGVDNRLGHLDQRPHPDKGSRRPESEGRTRAEEMRILIPNHSNDEREQCHLKGRQEDDEHLQHVDRRAGGERNGKKDGESGENPWPPPMLYRAQQNIHGHN